LIYLGPGRDRQAQAPPKTIEAKTSKDGHKRLTTHIKKDVNPVGKKKTKSNQSEGKGEGGSGHRGRLTCGAEGGEV